MNALTMSLAIVVRGGELDRLADLFEVLEVLQPRPVPEPWRLEPGTVGHAASSLWPRGAVTS